MTVKTLGSNAADSPGTEDALLISTVHSVLNNQPDTGGAAAVIRFTGWADIPAGAIISDVKLTMKCTSGGPVAADLTIREVFQPVVETQCWWDQYATGGVWNTLGCLGDGVDRGGANLCSLPYPGIFDVSIQQSNSTPAFVAWAQGVLDSNFHPWLYIGPAGSEAWALHANATNGFRPFLTVTYTSGMQSSGGVAFTGTAVLTAAGIAGIPLMGQAIL